MTSVPWTPAWAYVAAVGTYACAWLVVGPHRSSWAALAHFAALAAATGYLLVQSRREGWRHQLGLASVSWPRDVALGTIGFLVFGSLWPAVEALAATLGIPMFWPSFMEDETQGAPAVVVAAAAILIAPVCEEIWFRGYGYAWLRQAKVSTWVSLAILSLVFGAIHLYGGPGFAVFITFWAAGVGILRVVSRGLVAPVTMHVLNNVFAYVVVPLVFA